MKGKEKPSSKKPLLYIAQPDFQEPKFRMQSHYSSTSNKPSASFNSESAATAEQSKVKRRNSYVKTEEEFVFHAEEKKPEENQEEKPVPVSAADYFRDHSQYSEPSRARLTPVKSFTAMTIEEKLHHLSARAQFYSCTFSTAEKKVIGRLYEVQDKIIIVKADSGEFFTIEKKDLKAIRING